jgi:hypothetical protein
VLVASIVALIATCACSLSGCSAPLPDDVTAAQITWHRPFSGVPVPPSALNQGEARSLVHAIDASPGVARRPHQLSE